VECSRCRLGLGQQRGARLSAPPQLLPLPAWWPPVGWHSGLQSRSVAPPRLVLRHHHSGGSSGSSDTEDHVRLAIERSIFGSRSPSTSPRTSERGAASAPVVDCPICFELGPKVRYHDVRNESWHNGDRCDAHGICRPCLKRHIEVQLEEGKWSIRCPGEGCRYRLVDQDAFAELDDEAKETYRKLRSESFAPRLENVVLAAAGDASVARLAQDCQVCPDCSVLVARDGGCKHIACCCGCDFCYGCGAPFNPKGAGCICAEDEDDEDSDGSVLSDEGEGTPALGLWLVRYRPERLQPALVVALQEATQGRRTREPAAPAHVGHASRVDFDELELASDSDDTESFHGSDPEADPTSPRSTGSSVTLELMEEEPTPTKESKAEEWQPVAALVDIGAAPPVAAKVLGLTRAQSAPGRVR